MWTTLLIPLKGITSHPLSQFEIDNDVTNAMLAGCYGTLGLESGGVADTQLSASSVWEWSNLNGQHSVWATSGARLKRAGPPWSPSQSDQQQWLQIDLKREKRITGTQLHRFRFFFQHHTAGKRVLSNIFPKVLACRWSTVAWQGRPSTLVLKYFCQIAIISWYSEEESSNHGCGIYLLVSEYLEIIWILVKKIPTRLPEYQVLFSTNRKLSFLNIRDRAA